MATKTKGDQAMIMIGDENLQEHWEALRNLEDHTRLHLARELVRLVLYSPHDGARLDASSKGALEEIDKTLQMILGFINLGRISRHLKDLADSKEE